MKGNTHLDTKCEGENVFDIAIILMCVIVS